MYRSLGTMMIDPLNLIYDMGNHCHFFGNLGQQPEVVDQIGVCTIQVYVEAYRQINVFIQIIKLKLSASTMQPQ